jgi:cysteine desulfurase / selenocysteine lyase
VSAVKLNQTSESALFNVQALRAQFPALHQEVHGKPLAYLDNAATTQKPQSVIDALTHYYTFDNSNVHRGVHALSERATEKYEGARDRVASFVNAPDRSAVIFTRGATESINLVASAYVEPILRAGDEILISTMEHHSNIVPWQILAERVGASVKVMPMDDLGVTDLDAGLAMINARTRFVSVNHVSNSLGTVNPVREIVAAAHAKGIRVLLDGAQAMPHTQVDVQALDCDFYAFSGHKIYAPTGIGALVGKLDALEEMRPYQSGGDMIRRVTFDETTYNDLPYKFEAGTPHICGAIGLGAALEFVDSVGIDNIARHESTLIEHAHCLANGVTGLKIIGQAPGKAAVFSFVMDDIHPHDIGTILDTEGLAVRAGHHCTMPAMQRLSLPATTRASFGMYNTLEEVERLFSGLDKVRDIFGQ